MSNTDRVWYLAISYFCRIKYNSEYRINCTPTTNQKGTELAISKDNDCQYNLDHHSPWSDKLKYIHVVNSPKVLVLL